MRVLMLGWEFPPFISGGLGTACYGLTRALSDQGVEVLFVLPKAVAPNYSSHVELITPRPPDASGDEGRQPADRIPVPGGQSTIKTYRMEQFEHVTFFGVPSIIRSPYQAVGANQRGEQTSQTGQHWTSEQTTMTTPGQPAPAGAARPAGGGPPAMAPAAGDYGEDLMQTIQRYADMCVHLTRGREFDVIHAHDWMTYPAGLAVAGVSGKPLVVHVHSTEFDRAGTNVNSVIYEIERRGMQGAMAVMCVSHLTRNMVISRYTIDPEKVRVVYNGIEGNDALSEPRTTIRRDDKIVLFLGRITLQKGPEYFVAAAKKVLQKFDKVKFVMAGSGDMTRRVIELASEMGIGHKVLFTGFLRGNDVERVFKMADVYVMPSVSEPFGLAPLEAIRHDVPVIISKSSGVSEVVAHALKVDFWDIDEMANKIIAVLKHPPLSQTLREHADFEVKKLTWDDAARKCAAAYEDVVQAVPGD